MNGIELPDGFFEPGNDDVMKDGGPVI